MDDVPGAIAEALASWYHAVAGAGWSAESFAGTDPIN
jgi:hypothetical protein